MSNSAILFDWQHIFKADPVHEECMFSPLVFMKGKMENYLKAFGHKNSYRRETYSTVESELGVSFLLAQKLL